MCVGSDDIKNVRHQPTNRLITWLKKKKKRGTRTAIIYNIKIEATQEKPKAQNACLHKTFKKLVGLI